MHAAAALPECGQWGGAAPSCAQRCARVALPRRHCWAPPGVAAGVAAVADWLDFLKKQIEAMAQLVRGDLTRLQRTLMGALVVIDVHAHEPETVYVVPIKSDSEHFPIDGKLNVYRSRTGGNEWERLSKGLPQSDCYVNVLRDAMAVDTLDSCGVYFGTTGGQVYVSSDAGDNWKPIVRDLPSVLSVEVQTLA